MEKNLLVDLWDLKGGNETQRRAGLGLRGGDQIRVWVGNKGPGFY